MPVACWRCFGSIPSINGADQGRILENRVPVVPGGALNASKTVALAGPAACPSEGLLEECRTNGTPITENEPIEPSGIELPAQHNSFLIAYDDLILFTGATGFIGFRVIERLLDLGFRNVRCLVRPSSDVRKLKAICQRKEHGVRVEVIIGNLLSPEACASVTENVAAIVHLAAARGEKSFPDAYMNSVITTRNLIESALRHRRLRRFVNVSSFSVYDNSATNGGRGRSRSPLPLRQNCARGERLEVRSRSVASR